ncbi:MAG: 4-(cytidine 5'-diphospho)-2-C-methyl-D-erythritol kinase [Bacillota bacterium]
MRLSLAAPAKLNLTLDVLRRRADGYHDIASIMVPLELHDTLDLEEAADITLSCDLPGLPEGPENLVLAAARLLRESTGAGRGAHIRLTKRIPVAAGLAGGSTDAAQTLLGLNRLWGLNLKPDRLLELALRLGSDVPFCFLGRPALAEGRGEHLRPLPPAPPLHLALVKLDVPKSTGEVYRALSPERMGYTSLTAKVLDGLKRNDPEAVGRGLGNTLEAVMFERFPQLASLKRALLDAGAVAVGMSGSGPTLFALARSGEDAERLAAKVARLASWTTATRVGWPDQALSLPDSAE